MRFDNYFYMQRNRSEFDFDTIDWENFRMIGTKKFPIKIMGEIEAFDVEGYSPDEITLTLLLKHHHSCGIPIQGLSHCMQFLFYDFRKAMHLVLFNAQITKINNIPKIGNGRRFGITIASIRNNHTAAYKVYEMEHDAI